MRYLEKLADKKWSLPFVIGLGMLWVVLILGLRLLVRPVIRAECVDKETKLPVEALDNIMRFYTEEEAFAMIASCSDKGRQVYAWAEVFDIVVLPVVIALASALGIVLATRKLWGDDTKAKWLAIIPMIYLLTDWSENISILTMIISYPERRHALGAFVGFITPIKWVLGYAGAALAIGLLIIWGARSWLSRGKA